MSSYEGTVPPLLPSSATTPDTAPHEGAVGVGDQEASGPLALLSLVRRLHRAESVWARDVMGATESELAALQVLATAKANTRVLRQRDLGTALGITAASVSVLVDRLVLRGFVERLPHPEDRRSYEIEITPRAEAGVGVLLTGLRESMRTVIQRLAPGERETVSVFLGELAGVMETSSAR